MSASVQSGGVPDQGAPRHAGAASESPDERLLLLVEASSELIATSDVETLLPRVLGLAVRLIDADAYALWSFDPARSEWAVLASEGLSPDYLESAAIAVTATTPTMHETLVVADVAREPILEDRLDGYAAEGVRSLLVVALRAHGDMFGTLTFYYRKRHESAAHEVRLAEALAGIASAAINAARAGRQLQDTNDELAGANERLALLSECSSILAESIDEASIDDESARDTVSAALARVSGRLVPSFADACVIDIFEGRGFVRRAEMTTSEGVDLKALAGTRVRNWRIAPDDSRTVADVIHAGAPMLAPSIDDAWLQACAPDAEQLASGRALGANSFAICPLVSRGTVIGTISVLSTSAERRLTPADMQMLSEVGRRTAAAIDNARLLAETRRAADELRAANAAKDEFLGLVSHELRTPLTAVKGNAEVLLQRIRHIDEEGREAALRDIANESERLNRIIDNLLFLARLEQGQEAEREPLVVVRIVERVIARHRRHNPTRVFDIAERDRPRPVSFVEGYLEQVIENLVSNAEKYSPRSEAIRIEIERDDVEVRIRVLDRGVGITQQEAERLFEPFYRADATSGRAAGLGIGLSVCKRLVNAQGGRVWARPREGGGAEFGFALPIIDDEDV